MYVDDLTEVNLSCGRKIFPHVATGRGSSNTQKIDNPEYTIRTRLNCYTVNVDQTTAHPIQLY